MLNRRHACGALMGAVGSAVGALAGTWPGQAVASDDTFPSKPLTMLIPAPPGGGLDNVARALADEMGKILKQPVLVDNRPGGSGVIATQLAVKAPPDGYTMTLTITQAVLNSLFMLPKMPYDPRRDLAFISEICTAQLVMVVNPDVPAKTPAELLAWMKANPERATYGSWGAGAFGHIVGSYWSKSRGVPMVHVPYKGEVPIVQDMLGGRLTWAMATLSTARAHIESGKLRALAVTGNKRVDYLPQVPTFAQAGLGDPQLALTGSMLLMAPAATPPAVLAKLEKVSLAALDTPAVRARMAFASLIPLGWDGKKSRANYDAVYPVQERLFKELNIKAE